MMTLEDRRAGWLDIPRWIRIPFWHVWLIDRAIWGDDSSAVKAGLVALASVWTSLVVALLTALPLTLVLSG